MTQSHEEEVFPEIGPITADLTAYIVEGGYCSLCLHAYGERVLCTTVPNRWTAIQEFDHCERGHTCIDTVPCPTPVPVWDRTAVAA